jgi:putative ABC transport system ATP-binding protein
MHDTPKLPPEINAAVSSAAALTVPILRAEAVGRQVNLGTHTLTILSEVSFQLDAGRSLAIVGESGSGKSTLLGLLAGLDRPSQGEVTLAGARLSSLDEDGLARLRAQQVGFVFQSFQLLGTLTALDNVSLPLELTGQPEAQKTAEAILRRVGLGARLEHLPSQLSGGEQQRVAIARAFATRPKLLFADEPTGNLDTATGASVIDLLFELNAENGTTLVLVTHDERLAQRCGARLRLSGGCVVSRGGA